ncbi:hypothetical protein [Shewanella algae]|uniref:hypothetical protein n=1 Tax=Shewanella algae TaxID=38313 RepID=UPI001C7E8479|nr:hypothetical protein [Shewanella algae]
MKCNVHGCNLNAYGNDYCVNHRYESSRPVEKVPEDKETVKPTEIKSGEKVLKPKTKRATKSKKNDE